MTEPLDPAKLDELVEDAPPCSRCGALHPKYRDDPEATAALGLLAARGTSRAHYADRDEWLEVWVAACEEAGAWPGVKRDMEGWDEYIDAEHMRWGETVEKFGAPICTACLTGPELTQLNLPWVAVILSGEEKMRAAGEQPDAELIELADGILADADRDREAGIRYGEADSD